MKKTEKKGVKEKKADKDRPLAKKIVPKTVPGKVIFWLILALIAVNVLYMFVAMKANPWDQKSVIPSIPSDIPSDAPSDAQSIDMQWFGDLIYPVISVLAILASFQAVRFIRKLYSEGFRLKNAVFRVFLLLTAGVVFWAIGELIWQITGVIGETPGLSFVEYFYIAGSILLFLGFLFLATYIYNEHSESGSEILLFGIISIISTVVIFMFITQMLVGDVPGLSSFEIFIQYFYPMMSGFMFAASIVIYYFFRQTVMIGKPIIFLALFALCNFAGDLMYTYYSWTGSYGIMGALSDSAFAISYIFMFFCFLLLHRVKGIRGLIEVPE